MRMSKFFSEIGKKLDWEYTNISVYGKYEGYFVVFGQNALKKIVSVDFDVSDNKRILILVEKLKERRKEHRTDRVVITENGIIVFLKDFWKPVTYGVFITLLKFIVEQLKSLEIEPIENPRI
jgi:hypothetical protein